MSRKPQRKSGSTISAKGGQARLPAAGGNRRTARDGWTTVRKVRRALYTGTRLVRDIEVLASGDPAKIWRRLRNKLVGRALGRLSWRLWQ